MHFYTHPWRTGRCSEGWAGPGQGLTLPVVLVVAHAGQGDHHGTVQGQDGSTEPPALSPPTLGETMQLASQVEGREAETRKGNCQRETAGVILAGGEWQGHRASEHPGCHLAHPQAGTPQAGTTLATGTTRQSVSLLEPLWH